MASRTPLSVLGPSPPSLRSPPQFVNGSSLPPVSNTPRWSSCCGGLSRERPPEGGLTTAGHKQPLKQEAIHPKQTPLPLRSVATPPDQTTCALQPPPHVSKCHSPGGPGGNRHEVSFPNTSGWEDLSGWPCSRHLSVSFTVGKSNSVQ